MDSSLRRVGKRRWPDKTPKVTADDLDVCDLASAAGIKTDDFAILIALKQYTLHGAKLGAKRQGTLEDAKTAFSYRRRPFYVPSLSVPLIKNGCPCPFSLRQRTSTPSPKCRNLLHDPIDCLNGCLESIECMRSGCTSILPTALSYKAPFANGHPMTGP